MDKKRASQAEPEPMPTRMEHAQCVVSFVDHSLSETEDLVSVVVAAEKTARALKLAIGGLGLEHEDPTQEDFTLLREMAVGLWMFCDQAKCIVGSGPLGTAPAFPVPQAPEKNKTARAPRLEIAPKTDPPAA